jgi:hypothetical protein
LDVHVDQPRSRNFSGGICVPSWRCAFAWVCLVAFPSRVATRGTITSAGRLMGVVRVRYCFRWLSKNSENALALLAEVGTSSRSLTAGTVNSFRGCCCFSPPARAGATCVASPNPYVPPPRLLKVFPILPNSFNTRATVSSEGSVGSGWLVLCWRYAVVARRS